MSSDCQGLLPKVSVLIVDDEEMVAEYFSELLMSKGCETTVFHQARAALDSFKSQRDNYDLVLSDVVMPDLRGDSLATEILKLRPDMPIVLCSGFESIGKRELHSLGIKDFLKKPIDSGRLMQIIAGIKVSEC